MRLTPKTEAQIADGPWADLQSGVVQSARRGGSPIDMRHTTHVVNLRHSVSEANLVRLALCQTMTSGERTP